MARQKVLIVDDDEHILRSTRMLLNVLGYDAVACSSARDVHGVAVREHPDLILQDLKMPGIDLPGVVRELRADPATAAIPVAFFSASPTLPETAAKLDAQAYLTKPFREEQLRTILDRTLRGGRAG